MKNVIGSGRNRPWFAYLFCRLEDERVKTMIILFEDFEQLRPHARLPELIYMSGNASAASAFGCDWKKVAIWLAI